MIGLPNGYLVRIPLGHYKDHDGSRLYTDPCGNRTKLPSGAPHFSCTKLFPSTVHTLHYTNVEFSYFRLRSGGGVVGTSKDVDGDDELEEVSDSEFDKLLDEQERGWENKTGKKFDYNYIATPKERKKMKRKNEHKMDSEFQELDDDEPDFDDLYSDQSDHDEGSDDGMDFEFQGMTLLRE